MRRIVNACGSLSVSKGVSDKLIATPSFTVGLLHVSLYHRGMQYCEHVSLIREVTPSAEGCEDCLKIGASWVHLRLCKNCGHVGCCDSSPNRHATGHFHASGHPIIRSFEPGEDWGYCYVDETFYESLPTALKPNAEARS